MSANNNQRHLYLAGLLLSLACTINVFSWSITNKSSFFIWIVAILIAAGYLLTFFEIKKRWAIIIFFLLISFLCLQTASPDWDARSIWLFRAKRIFLENNFYAQLDGYTGQADYPAGFASLSASLAYLVGSWNEVFPKAAVLPYILAPLIIISGHFKNTLAIIFLPAAVALTCKINLINGYMDGLVALHAGAIIFLQLKESYQKTPPTINSYLYGALLFSLLFNLLNLKNEGLAIVSILFLITLLTQASSNKKIVVLAYLSALLSYGLIWKLPLALHEHSTDLFSGGLAQRLLSRIMDLQSYSMILMKMISDLWKWLIPLALLSIPQCRQYLQIKVKDYRLPILFCLLYTGMLFVIYLGTPHDLKWHLSTSVGRAITPITLVIFLVMIDWLDNSPHLNKK